MREERPVVCVHTVAEQVVRALVRQPEQRVQERSVALREGAKLDVDDVVLEPPAVGEPGEIARQHAEAIAGAGGRRRRNAGVESQQIGRPRPGEVEARHAGQQNRHEIGAIGRVDWRERAAVEQVLES